MKLLIAADMEGVTGVVCWDHVAPAHPEYARFRKLMTHDVNAAVRGAFEGGAGEVIVTDGHNNGRNILIEELDPRARLNSGSPSPFSMVQGIDQGVEAVMFVGYHARIGTENAILEHTWSDARVFELRLNGAPTGEIGLNAAVCGGFGAPLIFIAADQAACLEAAELVGSQVEQAVVKVGAGRFAADLLPPAVTGTLISEGAERAVRGFLKGNAPKPLRIPPPITMEIDLVQSEMADQAELYPGAQRRGRTISYTSDDMVQIYRAFRAILALARG